MAAKPPSIQDQLVQLAALKNDIQKTEHVTLVNLENALLDPSVNTMLEALDHAVENLAVTDSLKNTARTLADLIRTTRIVATRERVLSDQAITAHG